VENNFKIGVNYVDVRMAIARVDPNLVREPRAHILPEESAVENVQVGIT